VCVIRFLGVCVVVPRWWVRHWCSGTSAASVHPRYVCLAVAAQLPLFFFGPPITHCMYPYTPMAGGSDRRPSRMLNMLTFDEPAAEQRL
jgi:hypothetical protein